MTADTADEDGWAPLREHFVGHYTTLRGRVRTHVVHQHLRSHLAPPPGRIVDVGGGAGHQSIPLARDGYDVTIVDSSPAMLADAAQRLAGEAPEVARRVELVEAPGEDAPAVLGAGRFDGALSHGVIPYLVDPGPMLDALCALAAPGGIVSILAKNVHVMPLRAALLGDWAGALAAFEQDGKWQLNGLGVETRGDDVDDLSAEMSKRGADPIAWYGVRLLTDGWIPERPAEDPEDLVLAVELEASARDPYRRLSRLFHLLSRRRS